MSELKDGLPTGRLKDNGAMMEIECYKEQPDGTGLEKCGTRWVPVSDEMRRTMHGTVVSMVDITPKLAARVYKEPTAPADLPAPGKDVKAGELSEHAPTRTLHIAVTDEQQQIQEIKAAFALPTSLALEPSAADAVVREYDLTVPVSSGDERRTQDRRQVQEENSGFNVSYYSVAVDHPKRPERKPYIFEVEDLIETLNMTFHEGTVLKSLIRSCVERELDMRKVGADYIRDAEKMIHSSKETLRIRKLRATKGLK